MKDTKTTIGALGWHFSWSSGITAVVFSLLYLGMCRLLGFIVSSRRSEPDNDIEIMVLRHQVRVLQRQVHGRVRY